MTSSAAAITGLVRQTAAEQAARVAKSLTDLEALQKLRATVLESIAKDARLAPARSGWARDLATLQALVESNDAAVAVVARARGLAGAGASR